MHDAHAALADRLALLSRRQLLGAAGSGAMLGSAWAALFRHIMEPDDIPAVTVVHTRSAFAALIAFRKHRLLVVDAHDGPGVDEVTELAAGLARRRIDTILAPTGTLTVLPRGYRGRWRVRDAWTLPDHPDRTGRGLAGRSLAVGALRVHADSLPVGAWRSDAGETTPWYLAATLGGARLTIASDARALRRLPIDPRYINCVICSDTKLALPPRDGIAMLAVPAESRDEAPEADGPVLVPLYSGAPVTLRLREDAIEVPSTG
jgi:hypothetical protein